MTIQDRFVKMDRENIEAYTPKYAVDLIMHYIPKDKIIWAPFSKDSHYFAGYRRENGHKVMNTHFDPETKKRRRLFKIQSGIPFRYYRR